MRVSKAIAGAIAAGIASSMGLLSQGVGTVVVILGGVATAAGTFATVYVAPANRTPVNRP
jgi:hypothetical protein